MFETLGAGRTSGKRATGLRVLRADGGPEDVVSSLIRNVLRLVDGLPLSYVPGIVSILATKKNERLGDLAAGTIVVRERRGGRRTDEPGAEPRFLPPLAERETAAVGAPAGYDIGGLTDAGAVRAFLDPRPPGLGRAPRRRDAAGRGARP